MWLLSSNCIYLNYLLNISKTNMPVIINMYIINMPIMLMYPYDLILRYYIIIYIHIGSITNLL